MKYARPILFSTQMVRALLRGEKTETRRVIRPQFPTYQDREPGRFSKMEPWGKYSVIATHEENANMQTVISMPYAPGDILCVRETWAETPYGYVYRADGEKPEGWGLGDRWRPSIHMPKKAARIFLRVTDVRAERLHKSFFRHGDTVTSLAAEGIDIGDQCRECVEAYCRPCCIDEESECGVLDDVRESFAELWDSTVKPAERWKYGWAENPWVWVIRFERCEAGDYA